MKNKFKIMLLGLFAGIMLASCSSNFCTEEDRTRIQEMFSRKTVAYITDLVYVYDEKETEITLPNDDTLPVAISDIIKTDTKFKQYVGSLTVDLATTFKNIDPTLSKYTSVYNEELAIFFNTTKNDEPDNYYNKIIQAKLDLYEKNKNNIACLTISGDDKEPISGADLSKKTWGDAWKKGPIEGLLVFPIAALLTGLTNLFGKAGIGQIIAIVLTTFTVRLLILAATFKSTLGAQKLTSLQPQIAKVQAKYQGNTTPSAKQRMSQEMMAIYQKEKVNPLSSIIAPLVTMPVFMSVYFAVSNTSLLKNGSLFGLNLGTTISSAILQTWNWYAIFLFILMAISQFISMKIPQWIQKKKEKTKHRFQDPRVKKNNQMQYITYIFLAMIIIMGWMMPAAMTVYWIAGSMVSIGQAYLMDYITERNKRKKEGEIIK
ncbi:MAG: membrane protein insertase YidC [Bacillales bacterium]|jgi:YidC/Oxa1 family membrane protein insertase|nr:membrane protein insertase YidC [Bacillales bacterium]